MTPQEFQKWRDEHAIGGFPVEMEREMKWKLKQMEESASKNYSGH